MNLDIKIYISRRHYRNNMGGNKNMNRINLQKKGLAILTIILFVGINAVSTAGNIETEKSISDVPLPLNPEPECYPEFLGEKGENNWYIDDVSILFTYQPARVKTIWYRITSDTWIEYDFKEIQFGTEGTFDFQYKWEDHGGNISFYNGTAYSIFLDKTSPSLTLTKKDQFIRKQLVYKATVKDSYSKINLIEFYFDDELEETITIDDEAEYVAKFTYEYDGNPGPIEHYITAIAYDNAGHVSNETTTPLSYPCLFWDRLFQRFNIINEFLLEFFKEIFLF